MPGNHMRCVVGNRLWKRIVAHMERSTSPLEQYDAEACEREVHAALQNLQAGVEAQGELPDHIKRQTRHLLFNSCAPMWRAKFDLQEPCYLPPMQIKLKPGATPTKIKRHYRWSDAQAAFLEKHLVKLVNVGIISHVESEWLCPIVLPTKTDGTWRLCVDPSSLNAVTVPMIWEVPKIRSLLQHRLAGCTWFAKFDFVAMFWQLALHENSRHLFSFYAGKFGSFCFNRVAMGALNSSVYTQKMLTRMFANTIFRGKAILENGLFVQTDDVLLYAKTANELLELIVIFLRTVMLHNLAIHPDKCVLFARELIYCGLHVSGKGVSVDPSRLQALRDIPPPKTIGDVWRFKASVGWIRPDVPLLAVAESTLNDLITTALKRAKRRDMKAADRIALSEVGWSDQHVNAWSHIKDALYETITTSFRDRRLVACIFTDASSTGWAICITQCAPEELDKPWNQQKHELLAITSGMFRNSQINWAMACKEAFPMVQAVQRHHKLLTGNLPFVTINDHQSLTHIFAGPLRQAAVAKPAQGRLARWAAFLRCYVFVARHIPGACNLFCDLLSRNGCVTALALHRKLHEMDEHHANERPRPAMQYAIIMPTSTPMPKAKPYRSRDVDVADEPLLPALSATTWHTPKTIKDAQTTARLVSPTCMDVDGVQLLTNPQGRILLPAPACPGSDILDTVIVAAHQGDMFHRSSSATATTFLRHYAIHGFTENATKKHIAARCRSCLACIKLRTGGTIPRPMWYLVRATRPFEYLHLDFVEMPTSSDGFKWLLVVVCDLSLTTLLHPCKRCTAMEVVTALVNEWLAHYPDPVLIHTDGGTHFDNAVVRGLARVCGWRHTLSTAYAKWTHAVAERTNKEVLQILRPLCRHLKSEVNDWPSIIKMVQRAMQRKRRVSRGDRSPIELTTSIVPTNGVDLVVSAGCGRTSCRRGCVSSTPEYRRQHGAAP